MLRHVVLFCNLILDCSLQFERALATNSSQGCCSFSLNVFALRLAQSFSRLVIKFLSFVNIPIFVKIIVIMTKMPSFPHCHVNENTKVFVNEGFRHRHR